MKLTNKLVALAVCAGVPVTLLAQPPKESFDGAYRITIIVPGVFFPISAISMFKADGTLKEIDYVPTLGGIRSEEGLGSWRRKTDGGYAISYKTELPNGQVRQVDGLTTLSASGDKLAGTATVKWMNREGTVLNTTNVKLLGDRAQSRLAASSSR
jgi:hypothetical protein